MSSLINLQNLPRQELSFNFGDFFFDLAVIFAANLTLISISADGTQIISGQVAPPNTLLIPYPYLWGVYGNFAFSCPSGLYPNYTLFGQTQFLSYFTVAETQAIEDSKNSINYFE